MRRPLTVEQQQRREERHQAFRALWKRVAAMPELERVQLTAKHGIVTVEGHQLSLANQMLIVLNPGAVSRRRIQAMDRKAAPSGKASTAP
jgi:hypothetical protein